MSFDKRYQYKSYKAASSLCMQLHCTNNDMEANFIKIT